MVLLIFVQNKILNHDMRNFLKLEEATLFLLCIFLFSLLNFDWWWFPVLLLVPDIGMIGYAIDSKIGAFSYNILHNRVVASLVAMYSLTSDNQYWQLVAIILLAHISLDRALGFGLKYKDSFNNTHLGVFENNKKM